MAVDDVVRRPREMRRRRRRDGAEERYAGQRRRCQNLRCRF